MPRQTTERPPKPYETFPLFPHAKGYWAKKVDGRQESFGPWAWPDRAAYERGWKAALDRYREFDERRARGVVLTSRSGHLDLGTLHDAFLTHKLAQVDRKEITARMFAEYRTGLTHFRDAVGSGRAVADLELDAKAIAAYTDAVDRELGWHAFNKRMTLIRSMFKWAADPLGGDVLPHPFRLAGLFKKRAEKMLRRDKRLHVAEHGNSFVPPAELRLMLRAASPTLRAQILLGYYCAFGNTDCSDLPLNAVNRTPDPALGLPAGWATVHFPRPKTEVDRGAVVPPEVVAALDAAAADRPGPAEDRWKHLTFLTRNGLPFVRNRVERGDGGAIDKVTRIDSINLTHRRVRERIAACPGRHATELDAGEAHCVTCRKPLATVRHLGFYALRHTAITAASGAADVDVLSRWQGHSLPGMRRFYVEQVEVHGLLVVARRLREKLGVPVTRSGSACWDAWVAAADAAG